MPTEMEVTPQIDAHLLTAIRLIIQETMPMVLDTALAKALSPIQSCIQELKNEMTTISSKVHSLAVDQATTSEKVITLENSSKVTNMRIERIEEAMEKNLRHSYAQDLLLHGVEEQPSEEWSHSMLRVKEFLTAHKADCFLHELEGYAHRLGRPPSSTTASSSTNALQPRPRPIIFKLRSRSIRSEMLHQMGKGKLPPGAPYLSGHLTPTQIRELKDRARATPPQQSQLPPAGGPQRPNTRQSSHHSPYASNRTSQTVR